MSLPLMAGWLSSPEAILASYLLVQELCRLALQIVPRCRLAQAKGILLRKLRVGAPDRSDRKGQLVVGGL